MVDRWNKLTVADKDPDLPNEYNCVISDGSIPNGEDNNDTDGEEQEYGYLNTEIGLTRRDDEGLMHSIVKIIY